MATERSSEAEILVMKVEVASRRCISFISNALVAIKEIRCGV